MDLTFTGFTDTKETSISYSERKLSMNPDVYVRKSCSNFAVPQPPKMDWQSWAETLYYELRSVLTGEALDSTIISTLKAYNRAKKEAKVD